MSKCKHCNIEFDIVDKPKGWMANHSRWCKENPKRKDYVEILKIRREEMMSNKDILEKRIFGIKSAWEKGKYKEVDFGKGFRGKTHTEESKIKIKNKALNSNHRRLKKSVIIYNGITLDSSWEYELAKRLDYLEIKWIRPEPIKWIDSDNIQHNYFPDFYLIEFDLYLDPKNPHAYRVQIEKIKKLNEQYSNIVWITSFEECKNFSI